MINGYCFSHNYTKSRLEVLEDRDLCNVNVCYLLS
jgi:hypothetical protein